MHEVVPLDISGTYISIGYSHFDGHSIFLKNIYNKSANCFPDYTNLLPSHVPNHAGNQYKLQYVAAWYSPNPNGGAVISIPATGSKDLDAKAVCICMYIYMCVSLSIFHICYASIYYSLICIL